MTHDELVWAGVIAVALAILWMLVKDHEFDG